MIDEGPRVTHAPPSNRKRRSHAAPLHRGGRTSSALCAAGRRPSNVQLARNAVAIGSRAARIAGRSPPSMPIVQATKIPDTTSEAVTVK